MMQVRCAAKETLIFFSYFHSRVFFVVLEYYRIESYSDYVTLHIQEFLHMLEYRSYTCKKNIEIS